MGKVVVMVTQRRKGELDVWVDYFKCFYKIMGGKNQCVSLSQGSSALFDMIEYYESATHLNISFNKHIGIRGWQAAAHMMRKVRLTTELLLQILALLNKHFDNGMVFSHQHKDTAASFHLCEGKMFIF